jgi:hypothetical protein
MYFSLKEVKAKDNGKRKKYHNFTTFHCTSKNKIIYIYIYIYILPTCARTLPCPYDTPSLTTLLLSKDESITHQKLELKTMEWSN